MPANLEGMTQAERRAFLLGQELVKNPEVFREGQRLAKKANPALQIPEIELEDKLAAQEARALERQQKLQDELMQERVTRRQQERNRQIEAAGFEVSEIEKIIVDEKCSYDTAMKLAAAERRSAEPTGGDHRGAQGSPIEMRPAEDWRKAGAAGLGGLRKRSAEVAAEMINNFRGRRPA